MRLIDADALVNALVNACNNDQLKFFPVWIEKQIDAQPTILHDMSYTKDELLDYFKNKIQQEDNFTSKVQTAIAADLLMRAIFGKEGEKNNELS